jgi:cyanophycinase-like exopeptidase
VRYHRACVAATGKSRPTLAYVGAASNDDRTFARRIRELVFGSTARVISVELTRKSTRTSTIRALLADADLVFFTGGDVEHGMALIADRALAPYMRELAAGGIVIEGISAGAIMIGRHWVRFPDGAEPEMFDCLGIVPASFDTHGEDDGWSELRTLARLATDERVVYGIPSHGCAYWDGSRVQALGPPLARFRCDERARRLADGP